MLYKGNKMKQVALIKYLTKEYDRDDYSYAHLIAHSITKWSEVSDEDIATLQLAAARYGYTLIERPVEESMFIPETIEQFLKEYKQQEEKRLKEIEKIKLERQTQKEKRERKKLEELKKKFEEDSNVNKK
jgi:hypothetical protein